MIEPGDTEFIANDVKETFQQILHEKPSPAQGDRELDSLLPQRGKGIQLAKALYEAQRRRKGNRNFVAWLASKMPAKTGYRLIEAWRQLLALSPVIAEAAIETDLPLFVPTKIAPYGKYTEVIRTMPRPPQHDAREAERWVAELKAKYKSMRQQRLSPTNKAGCVLTEKQTADREEHRSVAKLIKELIVERDQLNAAIAALQRKTRR
jgi:hypothetical protein